MRTAAATPVKTAPSGAALRHAVTMHWPEYVIEATCLGIFMISACVFTVLLQHPASPVGQMIESDFSRRVLMGIAMALTSISLVYSPWGKRSGAHMNPALTLTFLTLGRVRAWDALFYAVFQFTGGFIGVKIAEFLIGLPIRHMAVNYAVTAPGPGGSWPALIAEFVISYLLMTAVLVFSNRRALHAYTGIAAGILVATFIAFESPISGMSMNPARTFGSASGASDYTSLWLYFAGPLAGMLTASAVYRLAAGARHVYCAKLHHHNDQPCIFNCNYKGLLNRD